MHEAGLLAEAVEQALRAGPPSRPRSLEVRILDPLHVAPESARLHAEIALRGRGLEGVAITVDCPSLACAICGVDNEAAPDHRFCVACGFPLPRPDGPAVEAIARW